jgi:hypothetical protein
MERFVDHGILSSLAGLALKVNRLYANRLIRVKRLQQRNQAAIPDDPESVTAPENRVSFPERGAAHTRNET